MANGIKTGDPRRFNTGPCSKFPEGSRARQTPEDGRRTYRPKRSGNINNDEDNSPKTLNDKNHQDSSQKCRQQIQCSLKDLNSFLYICFHQRCYIFWSIYLAWAVEQTDCISTEE